MTDPITQCHRVKAKIYSGDEGTSHYYCPVCKDSVNFDGSNPKMTEDADRLEKLAEQLHEWYLEEVRRLKPESYNPEAQKPYNQLTSEQQDIDRYIARKILDNYISKEKVAEELKERGDGNELVRKRELRATLRSKLGLGEGK